VTVSRQKSAQRQKNKKIALENLCALPQYKYSARKTELLIKSTPDESPRGMYTMQPIYAPSGKKEMDIRVKTSGGIEKNG
jgi:hypothetical protein